MNGGFSGSYADWEFSWLESPIFDFQSLTSDPILRFNIATDTESNWDGVTVQYATFPFGYWQTLGTVRKISRKSRDMTERVQLVQ